MIYDYTKMRVKQRIGTISLYDFEGTFEEVVEKLKENRVYYFDNYVAQTCEITAYSDWEKYLDGEKIKEVQFDKLTINLGENYGDKVYEVWGERNFDASELQAMQREQRKQQVDKEEKERKDYERLKAQFEGK